MSPIDGITLFRRFYPTREVSDESGLKYSEATNNGDSHTRGGIEEMTVVIIDPVGEEEVPRDTQRKEVSTYDNYGK